MSSRAPSPQRADLEEFFNPKAVALIGSIDRKAKPESLRRSCSERWGDRWYLVNTAGGTVGDIPVYEHVTDIEDDITLAVVNVGTRLVPGVVEECGKHGVRHVIVFTAGFSEVGPKGAALERELGEVAARYGVRVFGPNTNTNAFEVLPEPPRLRGGRIGLITQSGHQGRPLVQGAEFGVAFSRWVPTGNELDYEAADFVEYFASDDRTSVIAGYFEGFKDPSKLRRALEAANSAGKPVVALKVGATAAGSRMALSHTGHLAGSDSVVDGLFRQHGVVRVRDLDELLETSALFAKLPPGTGTRCGLYSISGGSGTLMAEVAELHGVGVPRLAPTTREALRELIPEYLTVDNPVDNGAQFLLSAPEADRRRVFELIASDDSVDIVVVGLTGALGRLTDRFAEDVARFADDLPKPVAVTWNSFKTDEPGFRSLVESGLPLFRSFRNCFSALAAFGRYRRAARHFRHRRAPTGRLAPDLASLFDSQGPGPLDTEASAKVLESFGVPIAESELAESATAAAGAASRLGFPVVMKISSRDLPHRSDTGLVRLGISSPTEAKRAYAELREAVKRSAPRARVDGVEVQSQVEGATEMIVGVLRDRVLGPALLVGSGGVFAEVLGDTAVRPLPVDRRDAEEMITSLKGASLLRGARGRPEANVPALVDLVVSVARLATACGERLAELDLNPVMVDESGAVAVDWLMVGR